MKGKVMLTKEELEKLALSSEDLEKLLGLVSQYRAELRAKSMGLPQSAVTAMTEVVGDKLMKDIVSDLRSGTGTPGWLPEPPKPSLEELNKPDEPKDTTPTWQKPQTSWRNPNPNSLEPPYESWRRGDD
jgi:hypothetical protein